MHPQVLSSMKLCVRGFERERQTHRQRATEGDTEAETETERKIKPQRRLQAVGTMPGRAYMTSAHRHGPTKLERRREQVISPCAKDVSTPVCHHLALSVPQK